MDTLPIVAWIVRAEIDRRNDFICAIIVKEDIDDEALGGDRLHSRSTGVRMFDLRVQLGRQSIGRGLRLCVPSVHALLRPSNARLCSAT